MKRFVTKGARVRLASLLQPTHKYSCSTSTTSFSKPASASTSSTCNRTSSACLRRHISATTSSGFTFAQVAHHQRAPATLRWLTRPTHTHSDNTEDESEGEIKADTEAADEDESNPIVDNFDGEQVILIDGSNSKKIGEVSMGYAEHFCFERGLKLKLVSNETIPIYKTMTTAAELAKKMQQALWQRQRDATAAKVEKKKKLGDKTDKDTKEIKLSDHTSEHDIRIKAKMGLRFLAKGLKVQINVVAKRRRSPQLDLQKGIMHQLIDIFEQEFPGGVKVGEPSIRKFDHRYSQTIVANSSK
eukprot:m.81034 g.81034  ORF g.81034 m.81034 type:complete len:301 (+) comp25376_c0_seq3:204-1106(+)